jgi:F-box/leucine-rich repeat protein 2/20
MEMSAKALWRFLKRCSEIRRLEIKQYCSRIKGLVIDFEISKLEEMGAKGSGINDDALAVIGKRSCQLLHLDLNVTVKGVKEVLQNCRVLREIYLK